jgi:hypothetical protein
LTGKKLEYVEVSVFMSSFVDQRSTIAVGDD